jgi:transcriptional regulator CtsR
MGELVMRMQKLENSLYHVSASRGERSYARLKRGQYESWNQLIRWMTGQVKERVNVEIADIVHGWMGTGEILKSQAT